MISFATMSTLAADIRLPPFMDVADFLAWPGDGTPTRYELVDGVLRAMAPATPTHNTIVSNLTLLIGNHLARHRGDCHVETTPGIQPRLRADWNFRIPDLGVTCRPAERDAAMMPEPILLVEVLSASNAAETWDNVRAYASIPSVREILVLHATRIRAEILTRDSEGAWPENPAPIATGEPVHLASIDLGFPLEEAYRHTYLLRGRESGKEAS